MTTHLIGLDWGSTRLRAYCYGDNGALLEARALANGVRQLPPGGFIEAFRAATDGWPPAPLIACGMVGSRNGWHEVPYLDTPADVSHLARSLVAMSLPDNRVLHLVPGLRDPERPDVMRGEETQIIGMLAQGINSRWSGTLLLPGTHSKWVRVREAVVVGFATMMTGELYDLLRRHSVLCTQSPAGGEHDIEAFRRGVDTARDSGSTGGMSRLFSARSLMLDGALAPASVADYLSGLLIGEEIRAAMAAGWADAATPVHMVGDAALCLRYNNAATVFGLRFETAPDTTTALGLWRIATEAGLITHAASESLAP